MGTIKIGIPMYAATKLEAFQFPLRKTEKPLRKVMTVAPMKPYQAVKGWNGPFQGKVSRLTFCALRAA